MFQARVFSLPNSRISHFSKELWLLSLENGTQKLRSVSGVCSFLTGVSLLTVKAREKNHVCPNPSINTHLYLFLYFVVVVQSLSRVRFFATPWTAACQASLSFTISQTLLKLMSNDANDAIQPSHPLSSPSPPALSLPKHQGLFQWVSSSHQMARVLELQL